LRLRVNDEASCAHSGNRGRGERPEKTAAIHLWHGAASIKRPHGDGKGEYDPFLRRGFAVRCVTGEPAYGTPVLPNFPSTAANRTTTSGNMSDWLRQGHLFSR
jgi:hypothetical protein